MSNQVYDPVVIVMSNQVGLISLENSQHMILIHEQRLEELNNAPKIGLIRFIEQTQSNLARRGRNNGFRGMGRGRFGGRGQKIYC